jgi:DNA-binding NtrC family response regulator
MRNGVKEKEQQGRRKRVRIVIVEDDFSIARSLEYALETAGCTVVGMAGSVDAALELVGSVSFDVALLDIDLRGDSVVPVAEAVLQRGRRAVFITGYGEADVLPAHLQALPRLEKPVDPEVILSVLDTVADSGSTI